MLHNQDLELPTESISVSGTHIFDLDFKCLYEMFSLKCFSILDLYVIGEADCRFKEVVNAVFAKRLWSYEVNLWNITDRPTQAETTKNHLINFGHFISELSIISRDERDKGYENFLDLVTNYCSSTLKFLRISCSWITEAETIILKPIFVQLQKIYFSKCTVYDGKTLFSNCESLVELKLQKLVFDDKLLLLLENTFPKLNRFEFSDCDYRTIFLDDSNKFIDFFSRHQNLKSLILNHWDGILHLLPGIVNNCKQLTELHIRIERCENKTYEKGLISILTLEHLSELKILCGGQNITTFITKLKNLKSLKSLILWYVGYDLGFVSALSKLTGLQVLELCYCRGLRNLNKLADLERLNTLRISANENLDFDYSYEHRDFDLVGMIKRLINLKTLHLDMPTFEMNKKMYLRIVDVLRERTSRFQDVLQISCFAAKDGSSFGDGDCRIVRIINFYNNFRLARGQ